MYDHDENRKERKRKLQQLKKKYHCKLSGRDERLMSKCGEHVGYAGELIAYLSEI